MLTLPSDDLEKQDVLVVVMQQFAVKREYTEEEVNELLQFCEVDDIALFRRELVNFNYLGKDSHKGVYWVKQKVLSDEALEKIGKNQTKISKME